MQDLLICLGIIICGCKAAMFSGLNLAFFSLSRLWLEIESSNGNQQAKQVLALREDSNFLLSTILWANVAVNVLLTLLSNSILTGVLAFLFSTVVITFVGEIIPQAYFSRHALQMASFLSPVIKGYQILFYPVAKPTALALDKWLGKEGIKFYQEQFISQLIQKHVEEEKSEVGTLEGTGAINFLALDDISVMHEGQIVDPTSIIPIPFKKNLPIFPIFERSANDPFVKAVKRSGKKWVILLDQTTLEPRLALDSFKFLSSALFDATPFNPYLYCHRPILITEPTILLDEAITKFKVYPFSPEDDVIDEDIILVWSQEKRIITGSDILGRLLRGIVKRCD